MFTEYCEPKSCESHSWQQTEPAAVFHMQGVAFRGAPNDSQAAERSADRECCPNKTNIKSRRTPRDRKGETAAQRLQFAPNGVATQERDVSAYYQRRGRPTAPLIPPLIR